VQTIPVQKRPEFSLEPRFPEPPKVDPERTRKRLLLALAVLLVALVAVILQNWDFWFPPTAEPESTPAMAEQKSTKTPRKNSAASAQRGSVASARERKPVETSMESGASMSATTERAALPDLQVEVIAGNQRKTVTAHSNTIHVDLASPVASASAQPAPVAPAAPPDAPAKPGGQVQMSADAAQTVVRSVAPDYPLLARQMKVQGAVILQALISRDGKIEELHIVSGPDILAAAAREAVRQWHFRPYYQNGRPVQTQARVTVNFTISTN
jgi:TonB family protein